MLIGFQNVHFVFVFTLSFIIIASNCQVINVCNQIGCRHLFFVLAFTFFYLFTVFQIELNRLHSNISILLKMDQLIFEKIANQKNKNQMLCLIVLFFLVCCLIKIASVSRLFSGTSHTTHLKNIANHIMFNT